MTIGFFGDSYCSEINSNSEDWETYISKIKNHYNSEIKSLGVAGDSIVGTILNQFLPMFYNNDIPDVCIFCWTDPVRVYNNNVRDLTVSNCVKYKNLKNEYLAGYYYYKFLFDNESNKLLTNSLLYWFDNEILKKTSSKILHTYSIIDLSSEYQFKNGATIKTPIRTFVNQRGNSLEKSNHIEGEIKNNSIYKGLINIIENYNTGCLYETF